MFGKLSNHFSSLTDVRIVSDPWDLLKIPILRMGAEEWVKWNEAHKPEGGISEAFQRAQLTRMTESVVNQLEEPDKPGMRRRRRPSKAAVSEARKDSMREVLREAIAEIPLDKIAQAVDPNDLKLGLAVVGMPEEHAGKRYTWSGPGVLDDDGAPIPFTLENRLRLLGWKGVMCRDTETGEVTFVRPSGPYRSTLEITEFDGNPRNDAGELLWVPDEAPYGGQAVGDAITDWLLDEAEAGDALQGAAIEGAAANLSASPSGASGTSEG